MVKDPIFELINFYALSGAFVMLGIMFVFILLSIAVYILNIPVKIYRSIKRMYDERKIQS